jgi:hypothetical protein
MKTRTKIQVKNGRWVINGKTLDEYKGDRWAMASLLMSNFKVNQIQTPVDESHFTSITFADAISAVNRSHLKAHNHIFKNLGTPAKTAIDFAESYPNIASVSFVRALGEE